MSDSSDSEGTKELSQDKNEQFLFVTLLEDYQILFDKRMTPKIKHEKEDALKKLTAGFNQIIEKNLDSKQILKKFNNMKTKVKKIVDVKKTGNKKIKLSEWQRKFYDLWNIGENPILHKIPGACQAGVIEEDGPKPATNDESLIQLQKTCLRKQIEAAEAQIAAARAQQSSAEALERASIALINFTKAGEHLVDHIIQRDMSDQL
ncbi:hypothetical protein ABEB36_014136 [Hypothenemus hampei]|uniref:Regulatory protein zeste n=1 Tax=Hypothenemus hampei TaxID=57062 RepID=A0ABD1E3E6_HYPHA